MHVTGDGLPAPLFDQESKSLEIVPSHNGQSRRGMKELAPRPREAVPRTGLRVRRADDSDVWGSAGGLRRGADPGSSGHRTHADASRH